jgi:hypothetical protein
MKGIVGENHHIGSERHHLWLLEFSECPVEHSLKIWMVCGILVMFKLGMCMAWGYIKISPSSRE